MTEEQMTNLWLQEAHYSGRSAEDDVEVKDDEFEEWGQELLAESEGVIYPDTEVVPFGTVRTPAPADPDKVWDPGDGWEEIPDDWQPNQY